MKKLFFIYKFFSDEDNHRRVTFNFWLMVLLSLVSIIIISVQPIILGKVISSVENKSELSKYLIFLLAGAYILIISIRRITIALNFMMLIGVRNAVITILSRRYFNVIYNDTDIKKENENTGDLTQKLNQASEEISTLLKNMSSNFIPPLFQLVFSIGVIIISGDFIIAALFLAYFLTYILTKNIFNPKIVEYYNDFYKTSVKRFSLLTDSIKNIEIARTSNSFLFLFSRYSNFLNLIERKHKKLIFHDAKFLLIEAFLTILFFGAAFSISLINLVNGEISLGHFVMISSYILLLSGPLEMIGSMYTAISKSTNSAYDFIKTLTYNEKRSPSIIVNVNSPTKLEIKNISFSYKISNEKIFSNFSLSIKEGSFTTITGKSGSGKSTLARIICGYLKCSEGGIFYNGHELSLIDTGSFSNMVYYINQEDFIFMDTIRFNLKIANPDASDSDLLNALSLAELQEILSIDSSPDPLSKNISDEGESLSGGQKQRLSFSRIFLRNPKLIVLDESTSSLDIRTERILLRNLKERFPDTTIINISHRPSTFDFSDEIIILKNGIVVDRGSYSYLETNSQLFNEMLRYESLKQVI